MINIMLVAGRSTDSLKKYFNQRGSIEVSHAYQTLISHKDDLQHNYTKINKLVYVHQDSTDIIRDMSLLRKLIQDYEAGEGSFTVDEIVFFYSESGGDNGVNSFKAIMRDTKYTNFKIHSSMDKLSYEEIYNKLLGITRASDVKTKTKKVYRNKRDSTVKRVHEPENGDSEEILEPFGFDNLQDYEKAKKFAKQSEIGRTYHDQQNKKEIYEEYENPVLATYSIEDILKKKNIFIVTGESKSGVSVNTAMITCSAISSDRTVTLVNLTGEVDTREYIKNLNHAFTSYSMKMFMLTDKLEHNSRLNIINVNYSKVDIRLESLKYISENTKKIDSDVIIIECPKDLVEKAIGCLGFNLNRIFYSVETLEKEINKVYNYVNGLSDRVKMIIMLSENLQTLHFPSRPKMRLTKRLSYSEIKSLFSKEITIVSPITYDGVDDTIFEQLVEV